MTVPFWCIAIAWIFAYIPSWIAALWQVKQGGYDNHYPRVQAQTFTGFALRAKAAHYNSLEALSGFAAAVIVAHLGGGDPALAAKLSVVFLVVRVGYLGAYLADLAALRSTLWTVGLSLTGALFLLPVLK